MTAFAALSTLPVEPVVLLEQDRPGAGEVLLEVQDVADGRAAEG